MSKACAYCNVEGAMTKEHIWSKALIKRWESKLKTYNPKTEKFYTGEPVIKDVCANCNNVRLSQLDQYWSEIYDAQLKNQVQRGDGVVFTYSYDLLLRSLLKISFNSCRATGDDRRAIAAHQKVRDYILGEGKKPKGFSIRLQIVTPAKVINGEKIGIDEFSHGAMRCAKIAFTGTQTNKFQIRLIAIKSFWFYLIIPINRHTKEEKSRFVEEFKKWEIQPGVAIQPAYDKVVIPVEKTTYMHPILLGSLLLAKP
ncbi:MAG: hypothetical protein KME18_18195 [Phormidium tanganyikae FI6-MK23]|jgi:hypothetical protein|nr:hypothetical protein [Phormidium tanganyikae FI6-MK23]